MGVIEATRMLAWTKAEFANSTHAAQTHKQVWQPDQKGDEGRLGIFLKAVT